MVAMFSQARPPCVPSFSLRLQGEPVDWFPAERRSRWSKSCTSVEVLCMYIFWMDGEVERLALGIMVPDELKKEVERLCSIPASLVVMIDKEVEDPVVVQAPGLVGEFGKSHHLRRGIKGVRYPDESPWTNVGFCKGNSRDRNIIRDEPLLFRKDGEAKRSTPILLCDFS